MCIEKKKISKTNLAREFYFFFSFLGKLMLKFGFYSRGGICWKGCSDVEIVLGGILLVFRGGTIFYARSTLSMPAYSYHASDIQ